MQIQIQIQSHQDKEATPVAGDLRFVQTSLFLCLNTTPIKRVAFTLLFESVIVTIKANQRFESTSTKPPGG